MQMTEHAIQATAVALLRKRGVTFFAVPNGGLRSKATAAKLWREGVQAGVPDLVVLDPPPKSVGQYVGLAIEVKTQSGRPTPQQVEWMHQFAARRWAARIAYGLAELLGVLHELGYLEYDDIAPYLRPTASATDDGSTVRGRPAVRPSRTAAAQAAPTSAPAAQPKRGRGGAA